MEIDALIPAYNGAALVAMRLRFSNYADQAVLVIDDGSTANAAEAAAAGAQCFA